MYSPFRFPQTWRQGRDEESLFDNVHININIITISTTNATKLFFLILSFVQG